jgi:hypothetical protein
MASEVSTERALFDVMRGSARHDTWSYGLRLLTHKQLLFTTHTQEVAGALLVSLFTQGRCSPLSRVFRIGYFFLQFNFAGALWLPSGCVVATALFMGSRYHTALSCLLLNTYYSHTGMGGRAGRRQGQSVGTGNNKGPRAGAWRPSAQKDFRE